MTALLFGVRLFWLGFLTPSPVSAPKEVPSAIPSALPIHNAAACSEPQKWIVGKAGKPIYRNRLYVEGLPYYVEYAGSKDQYDRSRPAIDSVRHEIFQAFANAMTMWGSSLLLIKKELPHELRVYVDSMTRCTPSACLFTPPQVVEVNCRDNAAFILRLYMPKGDKFPQSSRSVAALAQIEGRTVALNNTYLYYVYDPRWTKLVDGRRVNLRTVLAHELGHTFGIEHNTLNIRSVMREAPDTLFSATPTVEDARSGLIQLLDIDEIQAGAILDMQLRRLAALERQKIIDELAKIEESSIQRNAADCVLLPTSLGLENSLTGLPGKSKEWLQQCAQMWSECYESSETRFPSYRAQHCRNVCSCYRSE